MYHDERMKNTFVINKDSIKELKLNLLRMVFAYRTEEGLDDTAIIQNLIDNNYITVDEILSEKIA